MSYNFMLISVIAGLMVLPQRLLTVAAIVWGAR